MTNRELCEQVKLDKSIRMRIKHLDFPQKNMTPNFVIGQVFKVEFAAHEGNDDIRFYYRIDHPEYSGHSWWVPLRCVELFYSNDEKRPEAKTKIKRSWQ